MSERPVVDFDHHSLDFARHGREIIHDLQQRCPVAYTEAHGGYWVVSDYEHVAKVARDDDTFASRHDLEPGSIYGGISIPPSYGKAIPIESDPPEFHPVRRALTPWFAPHAVEEMEPLVRELASTLIDRVIANGRCDLVADLTNPLPSIVTMHLLGLPLEQWEEHAQLMHEAMYVPPGPDRRLVEQKWAGMVGSIVTVIRERRATPGPGLISHLANTEVEGHTLSNGDILDIAALVIAGGVDTTTAVTSNALVYLGTHPEQQRLLRAHPERRDMACEEFLRYYSPVQALARTVTTDVELGGQQLTRGDRVLVCWAGANQDAAAFTQPDDLVLDRNPNRHTAFGLGLHRCIGSHLARSQFRVMLDVVLDTIGEYSVDADGVERYPSIAVVNGIISAPAQFAAKPSQGLRSVILDAAIG